MTAPITGFDELWLNMQAELRRLADDLTKVGCACTPLGDGTIVVTINETRRAEVQRALARHVPIVGEVVTTTLRLYSAGNPYGVPTRPAAPSANDWAAYETARRARYEAALTVPCSYCGAAVGSPCVARHSRRTLGSDKFSAAHRSRLTAHQRAWGRQA